MVIQNLLLTFKKLIGFNDFYKKPIGFFVQKSQVHFLLLNPDNTLYITTSNDGFNFNVSPKCIRVSHSSLTDNLKEQVFPFFRNGKTYLLSHSPERVTLSLVSEKEINAIDVNLKLNENAVILSDYVHKNKCVMYYGNRYIRLGYSNDLKSWDIEEKPLIHSSHPTEVAGVYNVKEGILLLYFEKHTEKNKTYKSAYVAIFDINNPNKLLYKSDKPLWSQKEMWPDSTAEYLNTIIYENKMISYWWVDKKIIFAVNLINNIEQIESFLKKKKINLVKHHSNPILSPRDNNSWENFNTFNPAALYTGGKVHILYRAQGQDYVSSIGYASSNDGYLIHERLDKPVFSPHQKFEQNKSSIANYDFVSGGGFGGCEDPRVTQIGDTIYMVYVAFDGWSPPRLALTSISVENFLNKIWHWSKPVLVSRPGIVDKSGCLLPEKINGKYVFFHRIFPNIYIDYLDDLNFNGTDTWLKSEYQIKIREHMWDSRKIGVGAPPIKTKEGWLLIYYGVDDKNAGKYHLGAMLLDLKDPTKVLHRSNTPILSPEEEYEMNGFKPGIAYPCGAVSIDDKLFVYYGGADSVVCVATAQLSTFLHDLITRESVHLNTIQVQKVMY